MSAVDLARLSPTKALPFINKLPTEVLHLVFSHLPISSLLAFAQTSQSHYVLATHFLSNLELAIFPKRIHSMLAFLEEECRADSVDNDNDEDQDENQTEDDAKSGDDGDEDSLGPRLMLTARHLQPLSPSTSSKKHRRNAELYQIGRTSYPSQSPPVSPSILLSGHDRRLALRAACQSNPSPISLRNCEIAAQNDLATTILTSRSIRQNLRSLTLHLYTMQSSALAATLSTLSTLQYLNLNFSHPYINDTTLPSSYWRTTPSQGSGSPIWNVLAGIGRLSAASLTLRGLRTLILRRAGITSFQLRCWIMMNPHMEEIQLEKVRGVDLEFTDWLSRYISLQYRRQKSDGHPQYVQKVVLRDCSELICLNPADFEWIDLLSHSLTTSQNSWQKKLKILSLCGCKYVDEALFCILAGVSFVDQNPNEITPPNRFSIHARPVFHGRSSHEAYHGDLAISTLDTNSKPTSIPSKWPAAIRRLVSPKGMVIRDGKETTGIQERINQMQFNDRQTDRTDTSRRLRSLNPGVVEGESHRQEQVLQQEEQQQRQEQRHPPNSSVLAYRRRPPRGTAAQIIEVDPNSL